MKTVKEQKETFDEVEYNKQALCENCSHTFDIDELQDRKECPNCGWVEMQLILAGI